MSTTALPDSVAIDPVATDPVATDPVPVDDPAAVQTLRTQIDALDTAIAHLITERAQLSRRVQNARLSAGGPRVELGREREIYAHYRGALGGTGGAVAEAILRLCRGNR